MNKFISLEENAKLVFEKVAKHILDFTAPIYIRYADTGIIKPFGTGVLYTDGNNFCLITAAHCLMQQAGELIKIGIMDQGSFHYIKGFVALHLNEKTNTDIAIVKLEPESISACLRNHKFLNSWQVMPNGNECKVLDYLIVGYPNSRTLVDNKRRKIKKEPLVFISRSKSRDFYDKHGYIIQNNKLFGYSKRRSAFIGENMMNMAPDPTGISGCGFWHIPSLFVENVTEDSFKLCGIMFEYNGKSNFMIANNIELAIAMI